MFWLKKNTGTKKIKEKTIFAAKKKITKNSNINSTTKQKQF